ncbi:hypothetical protein CRE_17849 [Caenorhabditis remanei]|uniref:Nucleotide-diphospho-sugar transferase domain-containing protein n=1 Tax=Caenorhabditis remanei TaxID=31234 RepID=E3MDN6_CAERE|nr:hypothetical protein CRE_17849 [Caenorhabditis remanei]
MIISQKRLCIAALSTIFSLFLLYSFLSLRFRSTEILNSPDSEYLYNIPYPVIRSSSSENWIASENIAIIIVLAEGLERDFYRIAIDSVECYARAHGYQFILTHDNNWGCDHLKDKFFRRHCVVSKILPKFEAVLFLDADIGVVNPNRKLQEYMDPQFDIIFYNRHFSAEIATGSYLVKNTPYSIQLLKEFSEYERKLPQDSFHGTDNGAIHLFLAEKLFPHNLIDLELCRRAWMNSRNVIDLLGYSSCVRTMFGASSDFGKVRILQKGTGYVRDGWLTNGIFSPERDFMLHGWKMNQLATLPPGRLLPVPKFVDKWYNPFHGEFDMQKCGLGNTTWNLNQKFLATRANIEYSLRQYEMRSAIQKLEFLGALHYLVKNNRIRKHLGPTDASLFDF